MKHLLYAALLILFTFNWLAGQDTLSSKKKRLDFAKTYFETGGTFFPSFTGKKLTDNTITSFKNPNAVAHYLNWGAFHFWGHGEFYVSFPLGYFPFERNDASSSEILHSVATGARFYPWAYKEKRPRPYVGLSWSALDFKQKIKSEEHTQVSKDFLAAAEGGILMGYRDFALRLGVLYFPDTKWKYPLSKTVKTTINTPDVCFQVGLMYSFESSKNEKKERIDEWNSYPRFSRQSLGSKRFGDFFIGVGPSISFSLKNSEYNQQTLPYLKEKLTSPNYFDWALGYHFQKIGLFTALSYRNPTFKTEGFGSAQKIRKSALAFEVNKYLFDYTGFTPFVGLNLSYDQLRYSENIEGVERKFSFKDTEPGITAGWDIQPGKNQEALILRTNLRWYPYSSFKIDGRKFDFSQLEYNLIQVVFYPQRLMKKNQ